MPGYLLLPPSSGQSQRVPIRAPGHPHGFGGALLPSPLPHTPWSFNPALSSGSCLGSHWTQGRATSPPAQIGGGCCKGSPFFCRDPPIPQGGTDGAANLTERRFGGRIIGEEGETTTSRLAARFFWGGFFWGQHPSPSPVPSPGQRGRGARSPPGRARRWLPGGAGGEERRAAAPAPAPAPGGSGAAAAAAPGPRWLRDPVAPGAAGKWV